MYSTTGETRGYYVEVWQRAAAGLPLAPLEALIADVIAAHPEHQPLLADRETAVGFLPAAGEGNPFLHLSLHVAVREAAGSDRPPGVQALYRRLVDRAGAWHEAEHRMMECLAATLEAARTRGPGPDPEHWLECLRRWA